MERTDATVHENEQPAPRVTPEDLALSALVALVEEQESRQPLDPESEITAQEIQNRTNNTMHKSMFFSMRFPGTPRKAASGGKTIAFPRHLVEPYLEKYFDAKPLPKDYAGRAVASLADESTPLEAVFRVINEIEIPIRIYLLNNGTRVEYIDEEFMELFALGRAEHELTTEEWTPPSIHQQLASITTPHRSESHSLHSAFEDDKWGDTPIVPAKSSRHAATPPKLEKEANLEAISWKPRYLNGLRLLTQAEAVPLAHIDPGFGLNALVALASKQPDLAASHAIGLANGRPSILSSSLEHLSSFLHEAPVPTVRIPDNWQTLEDVARDATIRLDGEDGLAQWVAEGSYGADHIVTIPYKDGRDLKGLTFCSPQLSRVIVDWVHRERARLERAIELMEKYDDFAPNELPTPEIALIETSAEDADRKEELRQKLQPLEQFAAMRNLDLHWIYELANAEHEAYVVDYLDDGEKRLAYFTVTEGINYLIENLAPPEYRTKREICELYDIPVYLIDAYTDGLEPAGEFLSNAPCANVQLMPHYAPDQILYILEMRAADVGDPVPLLELAKATHRTSADVTKNLEPHGITIDSNKTITRLTAQKYWNEVHDTAPLDSAHTRLRDVLRTREARNCDVSYADIIAVCHDLSVPISLKRQGMAFYCIPTEHLPDVHEAVCRSYERYKRQN